MKKSLFFSVLLIIVVSFSSVLLQSCGTSKGNGHNSKKIKRGKPIPCPIKDC